MRSWATVRVGDLVAKGSAEIRTGPFGTQLKAAHYVEHGCPVINVRNVGLGGLTSAKLEHVAEDTVERLQSHLLKRGDIVFGRKAAVDRHLWVTEQEGWMQGSDCLRLRLVGDDLDDRFASFCLRTKQHRDWILNQSSHGSTMATLNQAIIERIEFPFPPLETQQRIAAILGAYDDLIEVNRRRVAVLEEMARGLFEEWFVRFRFPGHENVALVDTPDGPLPEGWEYAPLQDFLVLQRGFDLPKSKRTDGEVPVFSASGHHGGHNEFKVSGPGVVTGRSGTIGQVHLVWSDFWPLNTTLYVREFKRAGPAYSFLLLRLMDLEKHASGAAVPTLNRNHVHGISLPAPPPQLAEKFEAIAMEKFRMIRNLELQNDQLAASRDLLLPRLISGQLSVEAAERQLDDAA